MISVDPGEFAPKNIHRGIPPGVASQRRTIESYRGEKANPSMTKKPWVGELSLGAIQNYLCHLGYETWNVIDVVIRTRHSQSN